MSNIPAKRIAVFGKIGTSNYGDPFVSECCIYLIQKVAKELGVGVKITMADVYEEDEKVLSELLENCDCIVYSGGGMNSVRQNKSFYKIMKRAQKTKVTPVFFNAIGLRKNIKNENKALLTKMFNKDYVHQITIMGSINQIDQLLLEPKKYKLQSVIEPGLWANETYKAKKRKSKIIGVGVIRPEIFEENGNRHSVAKVFTIYENIIRELQAGKHRWQLFTNGMRRDYNFAKRLLESLDLEINTYLGRNVISTKGLVAKISGFKAVVAARMHANIIATSLDIPQIGLVWNDKMSLFGEIVGCKDRYISSEKLLDGKYIVDKLEQAIKEGYNKEYLGEIKKRTIETIENIVKCDVPEVS